MKSLYLAHPFSLKTAVRAWELDFEQKYQINLVNPFFDKDKQGKTEQDYEKEYSINNIGNYFLNRIIINRDLDLINGTDGLVAFLNNTGFSFGTPMEIFYNSRILQKPTYVISHAHSGHIWINGLAKTFKSTELFEKFIKNVI